VLQGLFIITFVIMLALPVVLVAVSGTATQAPWFTAMRLLGLEAFTLIFVNIVTGALARRFYRLYKARPFQRFHITCGALGFGMALAHGTIVLVEHHYRGHNAIWVVGPVALAMLAVTIFVALDRKRLPKVWRRIHQINYVIFIAVFIKAIAIGSDLTGSSGYMLALKILFIVYAVVAALATAERVRIYEVEARKKRERASASAGGQTRSRRRNWQTLQWGDNLHVITRHSHRVPGPCGT
jgi:DMSO/TMAO reductase YedYZ heme-binding membrane subunit